MTAWASFLVLACLMSAGAADHNDVQAVLEKYRAALPRESDLAIYQLDWVPTLREAKEKAAQQKRPIVLLVVLQTETYTNLYTGHC